MADSGASGGRPLEVGYWLSSEEHGPGDLVDHAVQAEAIGFGSAMISDHFHPWLRVQGESPFVWAVIGGIAQATSRLRIGTGVTAPIVRIHPAIVAHAAATAAVMLEGRFFLGLGAGERLNEHVTGTRWPGGIERRAMLAEAVAVIRRLLAGGNVNHSGDYFRVENAELFTLPEEPPPIILAVGGPRGAKLAGELGDGMLAVEPNARLVESFETAGGAGKPRMAQVHVCWAPSEDEARRIAHRFWPLAGLRGQVFFDLARPTDFEQVVDGLPPETATAGLVLGPDAGRHIEAITRFAAAGFTEVYVHQIGPDQDGFFRCYADEVLPNFAR
jgi:coenzyme F420-dependent glucose-6-phosphate dehydrogenase